MSYIDGMIGSVPTAKKEEFLAFAKVAAEVFKQCGALRSVDTWGDDVTKGEVTDYYRAVQAKPDETIIFGWIEWPSKAARDAGMQKAGNDERLTKLDAPFDMKRMVIGGFESLHDA